MSEDVTTQLRRGVVEFCVLGLLDAVPMYGWQLSAALTERGLIASIGTLYPLLARLRERGWIVAFTASESDTAAPSAGPTRKYYRLTADGEAQLARFREQWLPFTESVSEIISKGER